MDEYAAFKREWLARGKESFDALQTALRLETEAFGTKDPATKSAMKAEVARLRAFSDAMRSRDKEAMVDRTRIEDEFRKLGMEPPAWEEVKDTPPGRE